MFSTTFTSSCKYKFQIKLTITSSHIGTYHGPKEIWKILLNSGNHFLASYGWIFSSSHIFYSLVADLNRGRTLVSQSQQSPDLLLEVKNLKPSELSHLIRYVREVNSCESVNVKASKPWYDVLSFQLICPSFQMRTSVPGWITVT